MATEKTGDVQFYNRLFRANSDADGTRYLVHTDQVEGGYFVCEKLPSGGTWQTGQLCYCTGTASVPVNKFYQYDGDSWEPAIDHTHPYLPSDTSYAGSSSQGGPANSVKGSLTITLNDGTTEGTNKFTFNGSTAKTINIASPSCNNGIEKNTSNEFVLTDAFYKYLLAQTFATPEIKSFSLSGTNTSGNCEVGTAVSVTSITHYEANINNISGNLTLSRSSGAGVSAKTIKSDIATSSSRTTVNVTDSFTATTNGTVTYTLSAPYKDTTGANKTATKTASVSFYWPSFIFASSSSTPSVTGQTKRNSQSVTGYHEVTTTATDKHIHFVTADTVNKITSSGFDVPFTSSTLSVTINGQNKTYNTYSILNCMAGLNKFNVS